MVEDKLKNHRLNHSPFSQTTFATSIYDSRHYALPSTSLIHFSQTGIHKSSAEPDRTSLPTSWFCFIPQHKNTVWLSGRATQGSLLTYLFFSLALSK